MPDPTLFTPKHLRELTKNFDLTKLPDLESRKASLAAWKHSIDNGTITTASETELQGNFLHYIFHKALGYREKVGENEWSLDAEFAVKQDATHADGYLGYFTPNEKDVRVVIELKDARSDLDAPQKRANDKRTPVEQAFSYAHKSGASCRWVIVSNMIELRLYAAGDSMRYELFRLDDLVGEDNLARFLYLLDADRLIARDGDSVIDSAYRIRRERERNVTNEFYKAFRDLRAELFRGLVEANPDAAELDLLTAAQKLLDRLVFVFFCEDRGMLPYGITRSVITQADSGFAPEEGEIWRQLRGLFRSIDRGNAKRDINRFNGGLFADDPLLDTLTIGDDLLRRLLAIEEFDFESELDVDILGHIFEQSISDIEEMKATIAGNAFDEKKGKRKKEGVYYTPPFVTRYIVEKAIGGVLDDWKRELEFDALPELDESDFKTVKRVKERVRGNAAVEKHRAFWTAYRERVSAITVLDPACGSGAFLVAAFDRLMQEGVAINRALSQLTLGRTHTEDLTESILRTNLYGVDINAESVEITKLSLWLKTADKGSALTALDDRIRVGNSIVDDPAVAGDVAFDWSSAFSDVVARGGFDVVVGNPPYVRQELLGDVKPWLAEHYKVYAGTADLFVYFIERGVTLLRPGGLFGIVVANKWMRAAYGEPLRSWLGGIRVEEIVDFGDLPVFQGITTYPCILTLRAAAPAQSVRAAEPKTLAFADLAAYIDDIAFDVRADKLDANGWTLVGGKTQELLERLRRENVTLGEYVEGKIYYGIKTGLNEAFVIDRETRDRLIAEDPKSAEVIKPFLAGRDVKRYMPSRAVSWLIIFQNKWTREQSGFGDETEAWKWLGARYPAVTEYLAQFEEGARKRYDKGEFWWELRACEYYAEFDKPKIIIPAIVKRGSYAYDHNGNYSNDKTSIIPTDDLYLLALLNSIVVDSYLHSIAATKQGGYFEYKPSYVSQLPIHRINESDPIELRLRDEIIERVKRIMALNAEAEEGREKFLRLLVAELALPTLSNKLEAWHTLSGEEFVVELGKKKMKLTLDQKSEWMGFFEREKGEVERRLEEVKTLEGDIDVRVDELYKI